MNRMQSGGERPRGRWLRILPGMAVAVAAMAWFLSVAPLDPEPIHDGYQFGIASALADGLTVQSDVFAQYGPVTSWLHALSIHVFGPYLLSLRLVTAILGVIGALLLFSLMRAAGRNTWVSSATALVWVAMCPSWAVGGGFYPLWPWPSMLFLVLVLLGALFVVRWLRALGRPLVSMALAGLFFGLAAATRMNYGLPTAVMALGAVVVVMALRSAWDRRALTVGLLAGALGLVGPVLVLVLQGAWGSFLEQAVFGPLGNYPNNGVNVPYLGQAFLLGSLPFATAIVLYVFVLARFGRRAVAVAWASAVFVLVGVILASLSLGTRVREALKAVAPQWDLTWVLDVQSTAPMHLAAVATVVVSLVSGVVLVAALLPWRGQVRFKELLQSERTQTQLVLTWVALGTLSQLYPLAEHYHTWWASPLPIAATANMLPMRWSRRLQSVAAVTIITPILLVSAISTYLQLRVPRIELDSGALKGMWVTEARAAQIRELDAMLGDIRPRSARFHCFEGLFASWTGHYLADSPAFVDWAWGVPPTDRSRVPDHAFACFDSPDPAAADALAATWHMKVVRSSGEINLHPLSDIWMYEMVPDSVEQ